MAIFSEEQEEQLSKAYTLNETRKNAFGYSLATILSIIIQLTVEAYGVSELITTPIVMTFSIAVGALMGEMTKNYIFVSQELSKNRRFFKQRLQLTEEKHTPIFKSFESQLSEINGELARVQPDDPRHTILEQRRDQLEADFAKERQLMREAIRSVRVD